MSVGELEPGTRVTVIEVGGDGSVRQRFLDLGLLPGACLEVARVAAAGGPVWVKLRSSQIALRRIEADAITVAVIG